ncbi:MAG: hypothetical protein JNG88_05710 [Phycisphaerales bacterium]|nr:hypothetical protein [Phycisphaerales bacterium]
MRVSDDMKFVLLCAALTLMALSAAVLGADPAADEIQQRIHAGLNAFDAAVSAMREDPARAREHWQDALSDFLAVRNAGVRSAALEFNIGNTYARLGDIGRAVLHYRRAERINPRGRSLQINLDQARQQVTPRLAWPNGSAGLFGMMAWAERTTLWERVFIAGGLSLAGWAALAIGLRLRRSGATAAGLVCVVISLIVAGSAALDLRAAALEPPAVLVTGDQVLRGGRGDGYEPVIKERLGAGVEVYVIDTRGDWCEVRLSNDICGWLPGSALERVE